MDIKSILSNIGNSVSSVTHTILNFMNSKGILTSDLTAKIVTILVLLSFIFIAIKFLNTLSKPIKYIIIALLVFLAVSVGFAI